VWRLVKAVGSGGVDVVEDGWSLGADLVGSVVVDVDWGVEADAGVAVVVVVMASELCELLAALKTGEMPTPSAPAWSGVAADRGGGDGVHRRGPSQTVREPDRAMQRAPPAVAVDTGRVIWSWADGPKGNRSCDAPSAMASSLARTVETGQPLSAARGRDWPYSEAGVRATRGPPTRRAPELTGCRSADLLWLRTTSEGTSDGWLPDGTVAPVRVERDQRHHGVPAFGGQL